MRDNVETEPAVVVIFGGAGDLTHRKLVPALFNLFLDGHLPREYAVIGVDRVAMADDAYRHNLRVSVDSFSRQGKAPDDRWAEFAPRLRFLSFDFSDDAGFKKLADMIAEYGKVWGVKPQAIFYLAIPPQLIELATTQLAKAGLTCDTSCSRVVVEKPFGHDLASARDLNKKLTAHTAESQIYRIDHYLGKETVQNLIAFRFANSLYEPIWNRRYIDHVQITVAEEVGVEHRGGYYDRSGALRDMVQNHLLQVLCLVAMEPPVSFSANEVRGKKIDVLRAIREFNPKEIDDLVVRGQYGGGRFHGQAVPAYRAEPNVDPSSTTETYAALKLFVDNWRWQDVPFYIRTGKRLANRVSEVIIQFRPVPHKSFPPSVVEVMQPNVLVVRIQPDEGIVLRFAAKVPGPTMKIGQAAMRFDYEDAFQIPAPEAYETLLLDVLQGDATLFMHADQVDSAWSVVQPILDHWAQNPAEGIAPYAPGSWGPHEANRLLARDGRAWVKPFMKEIEGAALSPSPAGS